MMESFLDAIRTEGKLRVVSSQDSHDIKHLIFSPVITRDFKVGILLQDKLSGKSYFIEVGGDFKDVDCFHSMLRTAFDDALATHLKLTALMKEKTNGTD